MRIRTISAAAVLFAVGILDGCIDAQTEQACVSDADCNGVRICTSAGVCMWPEGIDASGEVEREDAQAPDEIDASEMPSFEIPGVPGEPDGGDFGRPDAAPGADAGDAHADTGVECPEALPRARVQGGEWQTDSFTTIPLETVEFDASPSTGDIARYEWSIIERPVGSTQRLVPDSSVENPKLFLDLVGVYRIQLRVDSAGDTDSSCSSTTIIEIDACACDSDVTVQLTWDTPADPDQTDEFGTDVDLHYLHENGRWNEPPWDIFWRNSTADWESRGHGESPTLDIDDTNGAGPEHIKHSDLERVNYRVGAYYYSDSTLGESYATVRIYVHGQLEHEHSDKLLEGTGTFWDVASIRGPSGGITPIDRITQGFP